MASCGAVFTTGTWDCRQKPCSLKKQLPFFDCKVQLDKENPCVFKNWFYFRILKFVIMIAFKFELGSKKQALCLSNDLNVTFICLFVLMVV